MSTCGVGITPLACSMTIGCWPSVTVRPALAVRGCAACSIRWWQRQRWQPAAARQRAGGVEYVERPILGRKPLVPRGRGETTSRAAATNRGHDRWRGQIATTCCPVESLGQGPDGLQLQYSSSRAFR